MAISPKVIEKIKAIAKKKRRGKKVKAELPAKSSAKALDSETRKVMEEAFGKDFSKVKIHTGSEVQAACKKIGADAFTSGNAIYFKSSSPSTELVAHELTHVVQSGGKATTGSVLVQ